MGNRRIVKGNCVYEKKTTSLSDFDGIMLYDDILYESKIMSEGLIRSYTAKSSEEYLKKKYPNIVSVHNYHTRIQDRVPKEFECHDFKNMGIEFSVLISKEFDNVEDINDKVYNLCGWYPYVVRIKFDMGGRENIEDVVYIKYNDIIDSRKWGIDFRTYMRHYDILYMEIYYLSKCRNLSIMSGHPFRGKWLYHTTEVSKIRKIAKNGLCPRRKKSDIFGIDCIYFSDNLPILFSMTTWNGNEYVLLRFNGNNIDGEDCRRDKKHNGAYYTVSNIPPSNIEIYTKYGWLPIASCDNEDNSIFKRMNNIEVEFDNDTIMQ